jgi:hypothetical protein
VKPKSGRQRNLHDAAGEQASWTISHISHIEEATVNLGKNLADDFKNAFVVPVLPPQHSSTPSGGQ